MHGHWLAHLKLRAHSGVTYVLRPRGCAWLCHIRTTRWSFTTGSAAACVRVCSSLRIQVAKDKLQRLERALGTSKDGREGKEDKLPANKPRGPKGKAVRAAGCWLLV